jgi:hypothetical protein
MLKFRYRYFILAVIIFLIEVFIALCIDDKIIRPHVGDLLVVVLVYCFLRSFLNFSAWTMAISALLFSYMVEILQYFKIVERLGLQNSKFTRTIIGTSFSWIDIFAYTIGVAIVLLIEKVIANKLKFNSP